MKFPRIIKRWACTLALLGLAAPSAWAWGVKGHAAVAELAEGALTPAAHAKVVELLAHDLDARGEPSGRTSLAAVASWADEIREGEGAAEHYRGWHVRNNPVCRQGDGACPDGHCVDALLEHFITALADRKQTEQARNEALKWVVHLVGDLHQPLHVGVARDRSALPVRLAGQRKVRRLHAVWDTDLAKQVLADAPLQLRRVDMRYKTGDIARWMSEGRTLARDYAYAPLPGFRCELDGVGEADAIGHAEPVELDAAYQAQAMPIIRQQLERAGARLAAVLNAVLK